MSTTTRYSPSKTARRHAELAENSQRQADLYRQMAEALQALGDPDPQTTLGIEVDRMLNLADEMDGDADEHRLEAIALGYVPA